MHFKHLSGIYITTLMIITVGLDHLDFICVASGCSVGIYRLAGNSKLQRFTREREDGRGVNAFWEGSSEPRRALGNKC